MNSIKKITALLVSLVLLSGCYYNREVYKIGKTGKVTLTQTMMISPKLYNQYIDLLKDLDELDSDEIDTDAIDLDDITDYDDLKLNRKSTLSLIKSSFKEAYPKSKKKLKFTQVSKKINGYTYYGYKVKGFLAKELSLKTTYKHGIIKAVYTLDASEDVTDTTDNYSIPDNVIDYKVTVKCPYKPKTTYGSIKGKTVTINVMKAAKKYKNKKNPKITITIVTKKHKHTYSKTKTGKKCKYCGKVVK